MELAWWEATILAVLFAIPFFSPAAAHPAPAAVLLATLPTSGALRFEYASCQVNDDPGLDLSVYTLV